MEVGFRFSNDFYRCVRVSIIVYGKYMCKKLAVGNTCEYSVVTIIYVNLRISGRHTRTRKP